MALLLPQATCALDRVGDASDDEIAERIRAAKRLLGDRLLILGHHYQRDSIVEHADETGDSFALSEIAAASKADLIMFCGVHFMAESADILTADHQIVVMPNTRAGCSMADMANLPDVAECWESLIDEFNLGDPIDRDDPDAPAPEGESYLVPVTYMNSSAALKAFVGVHGGVVCTSSNAAGVMQWALTRAGAGGKVLFFPDQHLGRNTALVMGYTEEDDMAVWNPTEIPDWAQLEKSTFVLWHGYCSVHQRFKAEQIERLREEYPEAVVVVHPECPRETVDAADANGSTNFIREFVAKQPPGSVIGVGTEINLVQRLDQEYPDRTVICLDPSICPCSTMYMIHPVYLCDVLEALVDGEMKNVIEVDENTTAQAKLALDRMLAIRA